MILTLPIVDAFRFNDGSTVIVVQTKEGSFPLAPTRAKLVVGSQSIGDISIDEERMPGHRTPHHRNLVTRDGVDLDLLRSGAASLELPVAHPDEGD